jgi:hypothetical protein
MEVRRYQKAGFVSTEGTEGAEKSTHGDAEARRNTEL